jgi:hypothetical protein
LSDQPTPGFEFVRDDAKRRITITVNGEMTVELWSAAVAKQIDEGLWRYAVLFIAKGTSHACLAALPTLKTFGDEITHERGTRGPVAVVVESAMSPEQEQQLVDYAVKVSYPFQVFVDLGIAAAWLDAMVM